MLKKPYNEIYCRHNKREHINVEPQELINYRHNKREHIYIEPQELINYRHNKTEHIYIEPQELMVLDSKLSSCYEFCIPFFCDTPTFTCYMTTFRNTLSLF